MRTFANFKSWAAALAVIVTVPTAARAQLQVSDLGEGPTPASLVQKLLGGGVTAFNVQYTGATNAAGIFCTGQEAFGFSTGIILSSGNAKTALPPNDSDGAGADNQLAGDAELGALIPGFETFDAAVLEFDFVAQSTSVEFKYVFASEEYNEFVDSSFNDVFGFFVNEVNYALIPNSATPVSINNVNNGNSAGVAAGPCQNCQYFVDNVGSNSVRQTQLDGLTTVLTLVAPVLAGRTNHMKIAVADAGDHILDSIVVLEAGSFRSGVATNIATRDSRFWFTHFKSTNPQCATLQRALETAIRDGCEQIDLGFLSLPQGYRNDDNILDAGDAAIEALGLYYRSQAKTGELAGRQTENRSGSNLCRERKRCAVEYIAALGNSLLLETPPQSCTNIVKGLATTFPADLLGQARAALAGDDPDLVRTFATVLRQYNSFAVTNDLPPGLVECSPDTTASLKQLSRDPTTQVSCPGENNTCAAATAVFFANTGNPFSPAKYKSSVDLIDYSDAVLSPLCAAGGRDAVWKINPDLATSGRRFTVRTRGSNFSTLVSIWRGSCDALNAVACAMGTSSTTSSGLSFATDGTNTYYLVVEGTDNSYGKAKLQVTSP